MEWQGRQGTEVIMPDKGKVEQGKSVEVDKVEADGGVLWWGKESSPDMDWFRAAIREANGGKAPRVLDPFSGGGAIPLEAMRLGCDVVANDLNPVAWFLLKCTLEYPHRLAGQNLPLPDFALKNRALADSFLKSHGYTGARLKDGLASMAGEAQRASLLEDRAEDQPWRAAPLGWHVRAWGDWVLAEARRTLAERYPTYAHWSPLVAGVTSEEKEIRLLTPNGDGEVDARPLNADLDHDYLKDPRNPRWIAKPSVAYLWARTVSCKSCRATIPLLKTRWLCKRDQKRVALDMQPNAAKTGVSFSVQVDVPIPAGTTAAQKRLSDASTGGGTMSRTGARCPCCNGLMSMEAMRYEARNGRLGSVMTAVVIDGPHGKDYRDPTVAELNAAAVSQGDMEAVYASVPFGIPTESLPGKEAPGIRVPLYGFKSWSELFTPRQLICLGELVTIVRQMPSALADHGYSPEWCEALTAYIALAVDRMADYGSALCTWHSSKELIRNTFGRFALPMVWDYTEVNPLSGVTGDFGGAVDWIAKVCLHTSEAGKAGSIAPIRAGSAATIDGEFDAIVTDPPYYDAIPYSDLMDFFYVWLRRALYGLSPEIDAAFKEPLGPKWDHAKSDGELIDDASRFGGDRLASKKNFEDGMATVFKRCSTVLKPGGILVIVFANKNASAWETLVAAVIRAGFVVDGSLPIQTEMGSRTRSHNSAALSSSVWLVCRKRPEGAQRGWSASVLDQMRKNISVQMRRFWDAGIRGPDFVWAATGPALEAYSRHPVVMREASASGRAEAMPVEEFLREVRRLVVEFAVGRVLSSATDGATGLDDITTYYLLHRDTFGMEEAAVGACILYAVSCGLSDTALIDQYEILSGGKTSSAGAEETDEDAADDVDEPDSEVTSSGKGSKVRLLRWDQRNRKTLGLEGADGRPVPIIDRLHRLMRLWKEGDVVKVDAFLDQASLARDPQFAQVIQAIIELARRDGKTDESSLLESISNHIQSRSGVASPRQTRML